MTARYRKPAPKVHWDPAYPMSSAPFAWPERIAVSGHYFKVGAKRAMKFLAVIAVICGIAWLVAASIMCVSAPTGFGHHNPMVRICTSSSLAFALSSLFWSTAILAILVFGLIGVGKDISEGKSS